MNELRTKEFMQICFQNEQFDRIDPILNSEILSNDELLQQELICLISEKDALKISLMIS